jgi:thiol:disulfide interchange protein
VQVPDLGASKGDNVGGLTKCAIVAWAVIGVVAGGYAQQPIDPFEPANEFGYGVIGRFEQSGGLALKPATISAQFAAATADRPAVLIIAASIAPGQHTYSITQPRGGPLPTKIVLDPSSDYREIGPFVAHPAPHSRIEQGPVWTGLEIQEHEGEVTWYAPIELSAGVDPATFEIQGTIDLQVCETGGSCIPIKEKFTARLAKNAQLPREVVNELQSSKTEERQPAGSSDAKSTIGITQSVESLATFSGRLNPATVRPGDLTQLELTAELPKGGRIYALADRDVRSELPGTKPTLIAIQKTSGLIPHHPLTNSPVKTDDSVAEFGPMRYHEGKVTWTLRLDVPKGTPPGEYPIVGLVGYQACGYGDDGKGFCEFPQAVQFEATLIVADESSQTAVPITFVPAKSYAEVAQLAENLGASPGGQPPAAIAGASQASPDDKPVIASADQYDLGRVQVAEAEGSIAYYIALALVGGLILNLMPCVLPVIGLKVMSFVEQAGKSRAHALVLNLWFAAGIVAVFILLGVLAATIGLSWGGQFGSTPFNVTIAAVVFAMALSLLGVWEVPIPGFFGSGSVHAAATQEGPLGAFLKGVVTTVLATPCTAPFMAAAVAWAVTQPFATTLAVFASLGIGMASPYILIGVFPELLRFLPKPGAWMLTFKQISGFVLLATVIFVLSFLEPAAIVPTMTLLFGIALACWVIARTPLTAELGDRLRAWGVAGAVVVVFMAGSFGWMYRIIGAPREAAWQPFSLERLKQVAVDEGRTVLVDFSADWCINCKFFEQTVLHTKPVEQAIARSGALTMYADFTDYPEEIKRTITALRANGVPVIAIFPGGAPYHPIVFRGGYTRQDIIAALQQATGRSVEGPSQSVAEAAAATPMN